MRAVFAAFAVATCCAVEVSPWRTVLLRARSPAALLSEDRIVLTAAARGESGLPCSTVHSDDAGRAWRCAEKAAPAQTNAVVLDGEVWSFCDQLQAGQCWWEPRSWNGSSAGARSNFSVTDLPPRDMWLLNGLAVVPRAHGGRAVAMILQARVVAGVEWRRQNVSGSLWETHLALAELTRSGDGKVALGDFAYLSLAASRATIAGAEELQEKYFWDPLYYGSEPAMAALNESHWLVVARTSGNDDDSAARPLDPATVCLNASTYEDVQRELPGKCIVPSVFRPKIDSSDLYFSPNHNYRTAPLALARSTDAGLSWAATLMPVGNGVFPQIAYDASSGVIVVSYGALSYPRNSVAVAWSLDAGHSWSDELVLHQDFTTGYTRLLRTGPRQFLLFADRTPTQPGCEGDGCGAGCSTMASAFSVAAIELHF